MASSGTLLVIDRICEWLPRVVELVDAAIHRSKYTIVESHDSCLLDLELATPFVPEPHMDLHDPQSCTDREVCIPNKLFIKLKGIRNDSIAPFRRSPGASFVDAPC
jgi:hypothetical protein